MIPYDKRSGKIWYNDELVDWGDVKLHVLSHGLHYASCVFEGERVYDGDIFKLEEHTARFFYSARRMGFEIPYSEEEINIASKKIVATQNVENGYVTVEFDEPVTLSPNAYYAAEALHSSGKPSLKIVPLVATRDIVQGEELLSTYFTLVGA